MPDPPHGLAWSDLGRHPELATVLVEHAYRGLRVQRILRLVLVGFFSAVLAFAPPAHDRVLSWVVVVCYAVWSLVLAGLVRAGGVRVLRLAWLALLVDVFVVAALVLVAAESELSWTSYLVLYGFFLIPVIAATLLSPSVCAAAVAPTVVVYLLASLGTRHPELEPWSVTLLRTALLAGVGVGCVLLSRLQRSRVLTIAGLANDRAALAGELLTLEEREQRDLAEALHDGALQYVLAARQDLEDLEDGPEPGSLARIEYALGESSRLLRSTTAQLHPAVLETAGLVPALQDLITATQGRSRLAIELDADGWPGHPTTADSLLLSTARELFTNVVKHAGASRVELSLRRTAGTARLRVADDGRGLAGVDLGSRLADGHLGLASRRIRLEAAGGRIRFTPADPHGTVVEVEVPVRDLPGPGRAEAPQP